MQGFVDEIVREWRGSGAAFIERVREDQRPIVERSLTRAGELTALMMSDPGRRDTHERDLRHVLNTLQSEAAVVGFRADNEARKLIGNVIRRGVGFLLAAV